MCSLNINESNKHQQNCGILSIRGHGCASEKEERRLSGHLAQTEGALDGRGSRLRFTLDLVHYVLGDAELCGD